MKPIQNLDLISLHSCYACDYMGPAAIEASIITCPECTSKTLLGTWIHYDCGSCGFDGSAYTPLKTATIPCKDCGLPLKFKT